MRNFLHSQLPNAIIAICILCGIWKPIYAKENLQEEPLCYNYLLSEASTVYGLSKEEGKWKQLQASKILSILHACGQKRGVEVLGVTLPVNFSSPIFGDRKDFKNQPIIQLRRSYDFSKGEQFPTKRGGILFSPDSPSMGFELFFSPLYGRKKAISENESRIIHMKTHKALRPMFSGEWAFCTTKRSEKQFKTTGPFECTSEDKKFQISGNLSSTISTKPFAFVSCSSDLMLSIKSPADFCTIGSVEIACTEKLMRFIKESSEIKVHYKRRLVPLQSVEAAENKIPKRLLKAFKEIKLSQANTEKSIREEQVKQTTVEHDCIQKRKALGK